MTTTNRDYDLAEISKSMRGILMGCLMVGLMHTYFGYTNPYVSYAHMCINLQACDSERYSLEKRA